MHRQSHGRWTTARTSCPASAARTCTARCFFVCGIVCWQAFGVGYMLEFWMRVRHRARSAEVYIYIYIYASNASVSVSLHVQIQFRAANGKSRVDNMYVERLLWDHTETSSPSTQVPALVAALRLGWRLRVTRTLKQVREAAIQHAWNEASEGRAIGPASLLRQRRRPFCCLSSPITPFPCIRPTPREPALGCRVVGHGLDAPAAPENTTSLAATSLAPLPGPLVPPLGISTAARGRVLVVFFSLHTYIHTTYIHTRELTLCRNANASTAAMPISGRVCTYMYTNKRLRGQWSAIAQRPGASLQRLRGEATRHGCTQHRFC